MVRFSCAGQAMFSQRHATNSGSRAIGPPHAGHLPWICLKKSNSLASWGRLSVHDPDDGGNDFAGFLDDDRVADADVLAFDFLFVVERGAGDRRAVEEDGFQLGDRRQRARATDLDRDVLQLRLCLFVRVLVGDGVARRFRGDSETFPLIEAVDLHHRAIDFEGQLRFERLQFGGARDDFFDVLTNPPVPVCRKAELLQSLEQRRIAS